MIVTRIQHYVTRKQQNCDKLVQSLSYAYKMEIHNLAGTSRLSLLLPHHPLRLTRCRRSSTLTSDTFVESVSRAIRLIFHLGSTHCKNT